MYEHTTTGQQMAVSHVLSTPTDVKFSDANLAVDVPAICAPIISGGISFTSIFGNTSNCVINVNMAAPSSETTRECEVTEKEKECLEINI